MNFYNNIEKFYGFAGPRVGITTTYYGPDSTSSTSSSSNKTEIDKEYERLFGSNSKTSRGGSSSSSGSSSYTGDSSRGSSSSGSSSYSGQSQNLPKSTETTDFAQYLPLAAVGLGLLLGAVLLK